jgi:hypothetical protein
VRFGLGGGGGDESSPKKTGDGAGGGGTAAPAGYIEIKGGHSRFVAPLYPARVAAMCCATAIAMALIARPRPARCGRGRHRP